MKVMADVPVNELGAERVQPASDGHAPVDIVPELALRDTHQHPLSTVLQ